MKRLALTLTAEGRLAELEGRHRDAARVYLEVIRFGAESGRGGIFVHMLAGVAIQAIGTRHLTELAAHLDAQTLREIALDLEHLDQQAQTWEAVVSPERDWVRRSYPFYVRGAAFVMSRSIRQAEEKIRFTFHRQQLTLRSLTLEFAGSAFELEKGSPPSSAAGLIPDDLSMIPKHPASGDDLVYPGAAARNGK